jgi:hypothetical protein
MSVNGLLLNLFTEISNGPDERSAVPACAADITSSVASEANDVRRNDLEQFFEADVVMVMVTPFFG